MDDRKVSCFIALALYPLALLSITCDILLFFPGLDSKYSRDGHITPAVKYMGGIYGGGIPFLILAFFIHLTFMKRCNNRCGMWFLFIFHLSVLALIGAMYSFGVALVGIGYGPLCEDGGTWSMPFKDSYWTYVFHSDSWGKCSEPKNVVQFNLILFGIVLFVSCVQMLLCLALRKNSFCGWFCGATSELQARCLKSVLVSLIFSLIVFIPGRCQ